MSVQENVQIAKDTFAAFGRGDMQGLLALSAEGIEWIIPGEWPLAGTHRGHAGVPDVFHKISEMLEISFSEPREFVAQRDRVLVLGFSRGRTDSRKGCSRTLRQYGCVSHHARPSADLHDAGGGGGMQSGCFTGERSHDGDTQTDQVALRQRLF